MNEKTRVLRGSAKVGADAIKVGERVVATAIETKDKDGKALMVAADGWRRCSGQDDHAL